ncbi:MAG: PAS domain S-box protein [Desulfobacterales bacterium]|nr:PAS domain S-box protein [Desulfobacterales bacterium]
MGEKVKIQNKTEKINNILFDIIKAVGTTTSLEDFYAFIHNALNRIISAPNFFIAIYNEEKKTIEFPYFKDQFDKKMSYINDFTATHSLTGEVILSGKPLFLFEEELILRKQAKKSIGKLSKIWIGVPLIVRNKVIGVMAAQDYNDPEYFSQKDFEMFIFVSSQIAIAIERKRMMDELVESENRFRDMAELLPEAIFETDDELKITYANSKTLDMLGYSKKDIKNGVNCVDFIAAQNFKTKLNNSGIVEKDEGIDLEGLKEYLFLRKDSSSFPGIIKTSSIYKGGKQTGLRGVIIDISDRKQWEESLKESEYKFRTLAETSSIGIILYQDEKLVYCNPATEKILGYTFEEYEKRDFLDIVAPEFKEKIKKYSVLRQKGLPAPSGYECRIITKQKEEKWIYLEGRSIKFHGKPAGLASWLDITQRKEAEEKLNQFRGYLTGIINSMPSILVGIDVNYKITLFNKQAEEKTGLSAKDADGQDLYSVFPRLKKHHSKIQTAIREQTVQEALKVPYKIDTELFYEDITIYPLVTGDAQGAVIRVDDVTNQVKVESILIQTEKMISVGGLAAGMAHEINNPLAGMMQNAQVVYNRLAKHFPANETAALAAGTTLDSIKAYMKDRKILEHIEKINQAGIQAAEIVENMLNFVKKSGAGKSLQSLSKQVDKTIELVKTDYYLKMKSSFKKLEIFKEYDPTVPKIPCEGSKIQQVVFNILKNSAQAFITNKENSGALQITIRIYLSCNKACLEIEDNGPGMDEKTLKRVFEPFFTTKEKDKGTGLGLYIAYFIITEDHSGEMTVTTELGKRTLFTIKLPVKNVLGNN